jgi:hypothetical protein
MYRRTKSLEVLLEVRRHMAAEADHDTDLFAEMVRSGSFVREDVELEPEPSDMDESKAA